MYPVEHGLACPTSRHSWQFYALSFPIWGNGRPQTPTFSKNEEEREGGAALREQSQSQSPQGWGQSHDLTCPPKCSGAARPSRAGVLGTTGGGSRGASPTGADAVKVPAAVAGGGERGRAWFYAVLLRGLLGLARTRATWWICTRGLPGGGGCALSLKEGFTEAEQRGWGQRWGHRGPTLWG